MVQKPSGTSGSVETLETTGFEHGNKTIKSRWLLAPGKNLRFLTGLKAIGCHRFLVMEPPVFWLGWRSQPRPMRADGHHWFWQRRSAKSITDQRSARPDALRAYYWPFPPT
ncbi:hypothetical protein DFH07DRAFT_767403 [Mycena maculata]|uniref:Uncharacterized protein n=1 Tax=Mycena maculata TaxID=230809 RepID=A0AAD7K0B1_9AGAR|nr:hypothetical protein DFH07DRAFT_767403 [Mycena maculata]